MILVIMGAPGAGKGTQANILADKLKIPHISTGDILRLSIKQGTALGKEADKLISAGNFVSDDIMIGIIKERTTNDDCKNGYILDGFPRTLNQAQILEQMAPITAAINISSENNELIRRLSGRRVCGKCGKSYNTSLHKNDKCKCGNMLERRKDDTAETIINRIEIYAQKSAPLIDFYKGLGKLVEVRGVGTVDAVSKRMSKAVLGLIKN